MTETDNYQQDPNIGIENDVNFNHLSIPNNVIIPKGSELSNAPIMVIRGASSTSNGLPLCRICLSEENNIENPLFSPCKCKGTMKYIHLTCL